MTNGAFSIILLKIPDMEVIVTEFIFRAVSVCSLFSHRFSSFALPGSIFAPQCGQNGTITLAACLLIRSSILTPPVPSAPSPGTPRTDRRCPTG